VLDTIGFDEIVKGADFIITGEGRLDVQLRFGKALAGVMRRAERAGVPVVGVVGSVLGDQREYVGEGGFVSLASLVSEGVTLSVAMTNAASLLRQRTAEVISRLGTGSKAE
jgi:glycerate kinase